MGVFICRVLFAVGSLVLRSSTAGWPATARPCWEENGTTSRNWRPKRKENKKTEINRVGVVIYALNHEGADGVAHKLDPACVTHDQGNSDLIFPQPASSLPMVT